MGKRWHYHRREYVENPAIDAFIAEVIGVCKKHNLSISHEDGHGSFEIEDYSEANAAWLEGANDTTGEIDG